MALTPGPRLIAGLSCALALGTLAACAAPAPEFPPGVDVALYISRVDSGSVQISVTNAGDDTITILGVELGSPQFASSTRWPRDSTSIRAGTTVDLPVPLPTVDCEAGSAAASVTLTTEVDSTRVTRSFLPRDESGWLQRIVSDGCTAQAVADIARITLVTPPTVAASDGRLLAELEIDVDPTAGHGELVIEELRDTVLLQVIDPATGEATDRLPVGMTVRGGDSAVPLSFTVQPNRCDPHAIAEDKHGTRFLLIVSTEQGEGRVVVPASDGVRNALYDFVVEACAA